MKELNEDFHLTHRKQLFVRQRHEIGEWVGFETRNKYEVVTPEGKPLAYAAEQQKGILGFLVRQFLGHWRSFQIHFFNLHREVIMVANHPFRLFFQRLEIKDRSGKMMGAIQQRFSILSKRFDVEDEKGMVIMEVSSPIWKIWTFPFIYNSQQVAVVQKKWSGLFSEAFTDKDNFMVGYEDDKLTENERRLVLAAALFIDLKYFEKKAGK